MASSVSVCSKILVAAIDFGTTFSGYAFSLKHDFEIDPMKIHTNARWTAGHKNLYSHKTPTCILINPDQSFDSFGYEAEDKYSDLALDEDHENWYFFRRFKMNLYNNMKLNRGMVIQDDHGKSMQAKTVFSMSIRYLKNHLLEHLTSRNVVENLDEKKDIQWVLTVPAIWNDGAKQFMREAANEAGITDDHLLIALEPEVASMYCKMLPHEKFTGNDTSSSKMAAFNPGTKYMVLDLGGGTVDVTVHKVLPDGSLHEIHKASGNASGGTCVDAAFTQLLISLIGNPVMKQFKAEYASDDLDLLREFETKKRLITSEREGKITLRMPISLLDCFQNETGEDLKDVLSQSNLSTKMFWVKDKLQIDCDVMKSLFSNSIDSIIDHVGELLKLDVCQGVRNIIMVGGFSECTLVQDVMRATFTNQCITIPHEAGLAVLMGAVLFGHNPRTIVSRVAKFTYGVKVVKDFRSGVDPAGKKFMADGREKCKDRFSKHVEVGQSIELDKTLDPVTYAPLQLDSTKITVPVFISTDKNPIYTTDSSCTNLGKFVVNLDSKSKSDTEVDVRMIFGDTELHVVAQEKSSGKITECFFDFLEQSIMG